MKRYYFLSVIFVMLLTSCSNEVTDYELRLVENDNKFTINPSPTVVISTIVDNSQTIGFDKVEDEDEDEQEEIFIPDYNEGLDDSIVVEEDVIKADIEKQEQVTDPIVEEVVEEVVKEEEVVEEIEEVSVTVEEEKEEIVVEEKEEFVFEPIVNTLNECVFSQAEHTFSQTLINYVGKGNYEKWIANAKPTCENGLTIYDYMDNFNMTKSFFVNLTAYDSTYADVNVYAH